MPDPTQNQTVGQALAGQPAPPPDSSNFPLASRQAPTLQVAPPQPTQPTIAQQVDAHHSAIGRAAKFLFGAPTIDPNTGQATPQRPGQWARSMLAGALLGAAIGSENPRGGFLGGLGRGGAGVEQQQYERAQQRQQQERQQRQMTLEEQKFAEEKTQHAATLEHWNLENLARGREADYKNREWLEKEEAQEENVQRYAIENGAKLASIPHNNENGNGPGLMKAMVSNPQAFAAPAGYGRLLTKSFDFSGLDYDAKQGWTEGGKPVNWADHMKWSLYFVPQNTADKHPITMSGADWQKYYGVRGLDPTRSYNVESVQHLVAAATSQRKNDREDFNSSFKEKHDALNATIQSARTNVTQAESEKRELLRQGYTEDDDEVKAIDEKISAEQKRETDAISEMHPRIRERVTQTQPTQRTAPNQQKPNVTPPKGKSVVYDSQNSPHFVDSDKLKAFLADPQYKGWHQ